jgi:hypothetical protein
MTFSHLPDAILMGGRPGRRNFAEIHPNVLHPENVELQYEING